MSWIGKHEHYFEQLREFVPRDALAILEQQKQKVARAIDDEVAAFGGQLAAAVQQAVVATQEELAADLKGVQGELLASLELLAKTKLDSEKVMFLRGEIDRFEAKWKGLGKKIGDAAVKVIEVSTGIPVSSILPR
jgi:cob(I)alamin adenosyltransferase